MVIDISWEGQKLFYVGTLLDLTQLILISSWSKYIGRAYYDAASCTTGAGSRRGRERAVDARRTSSWPEGNEQSR